MDINEIIRMLEEKIENPRIGLPQEVFFLVSRLTPMVNVDLLIKDEKGRTLLAWRDDEFVGKGWHVPGGIIRFKEKAETKANSLEEEVASLREEAESLKKMLDVLE